MPVGRPTPDTPTYLGRVVTCDPTQRTIDVVLNASGQRIQVMTTPICARWPMVGETWTVCFINNTPYLGEPYQPYQIGLFSSQTGIEEIPAGDAWINSPTGQVHIIGSGDGANDFIFNKDTYLQNNDAAGGSLQGTYPNPTIKPVSGSAWIAPSLINSWVNSGGVFETAGYLKDPLGFVHLKGLIQGGASSSVAFVLPSGFRPGATTFQGLGLGSLAAGGAIEVSTNGNAAVWNGGSSVGLSGVTFLAEN